MFNHNINYNFNIININYATFLKTQERHTLYTNDDSFKAFFQLHRFNPVQLHTIIRIIIAKTVIINDASRFNGHNRAQSTHTHHNTKPLSMAAMKHATLQRLKRNEIIFIWRAALIVYRNSTQI